jgi:hypothetical protein
MDIIMRPSARAVACSAQRGRLDARFNLGICRGKPGHRLPIRRVRRPTYVHRVNQSDANEGTIMALFMDIHHLDNVSMADVEKAHQADLATQGAHGVQYLRYWVDEKNGKVFCLVDAPDADAAAIVHREAHGLVADELFPVEEGS